MPRKLIVQQNLLLNVLKSKRDILLPDGTIPRQSAQVWRDLSVQLLGVMSPIYLYVFVRNNRHGVLDLLRKEKGFPPVNDVQQHKMECAEASEKDSSDNHIDAVSSATNHETMPSSETIGSRDIHTCGACKAPFFDLYQFLKHKQQECSAIQLDPIVPSEQLDNSASMPCVSTRGVAPDISINSSKLIKRLQTRPPKAKKNGSQGKTYKCGYDGCEFTTQYTTHLKHHTYVHHTREQPYKCSLCDKAFSHKNSLKNHELRHTRLKRHQCYKCSYSTNNKDALEQHRRTHTDKFPCKCQDCPFRCATAKILAHHRRHKHNEGSSPKRSTYKCQCDGCEFACHNLEDFQRHSYVHRRENPCLPQSTEGRIGPFKCSICEETFSDSNACKTHELLHSGLKPHKCDHCVYTTIYSSSLKRHALIHKNEYPYKCKECSYAGRTSTLLEEHRLRKHTGENLNSEPSKFTTSNDLASSSNEALLEHEVLQSSERVCTHSESDDEELEFESDADKRQADRDPSYSTKHATSMLESNQFTRRYSLRSQVRREERITIKIQSELPKFASEQDPARSECTDFEDEIASSANDHDEELFQSAFRFAEIKMEHDPTTAIKTETKLPIMASEIVKVEYDVLDERNSSANDGQEEEERSDTSLRLTEIKVEPE